MLPAVRLAADVRWLVVRQLGQTKIQHLGLAALRQENIGRLNVAVDDAFFVRGIQGVGGLDTDAHQIVHRNRAAADPLAQRLALQQFHGDEVMAVGFVHLMNGADVGMAERRGRPGFAQEALHRGRVGHQVWRQTLERDLASQTRIFGAIHHSHTARSQRVQEPVM